MVEFKSLAIEVKDVDRSGGVVDIIVNAYNNKDSDGDISVPGCFDDTIKENFKRIKHLQNHDRRILLGLPLEFPQSDIGLRVKSKMNMDKAICKDVLSDYILFHENARTIEHSIGYEVIKRDENDSSRILKYNLYEYSTLSFLGANSETPFLGVKSQSDYLTEFNFLVKQYNANYSDGRLRNIETELKKLSGLTPSDSEKEQEIIKTINQFRQGLKNL